MTNDEFITACKRWRELLELQDTEQLMELANLTGALTAELCRDPETGAELAAVVPQGTEAVFRFLMQKLPQ